jgi:hypothetical protein
MVALEDVETQKRGIVLVLFNYHIDGRDTIGMGRLTGALKFLRGFPYKFMGVHYCCSQESVPFFLPFQNMIQYLIGSNGRRHFRTHRGKNTVYALQSRVINLNDSTTSKPLLLYTYAILCLRRFHYRN